MLKVGITGGIGTGKSTVCQIFRTLGIPTYDADIEAKKLYDTNPVLKAAVIERFGDLVYKNNKFQKNELAKIVFADKKALADLNELVHPIIIEEGEDWFAKQKSQYAIKEAALLIESGGYKKLDKLIVVKAPLAERIERIKKRDKSTYEQIMSRINKQLPEEKKEEYADFVIHNGNDDLLIEQVLALHNKILELCD